MKCEICDYSSDNIVQFAKHVHAAHNMSSQAYYDMYILKTATPLCPICKLKTRKFLSLTKGYALHCSHACAIKSNDFKQKISNIRKNTSKVASKKYKQTCMRKYGTCSFFESSVFKTKSKFTKLAKYNDENYNNRTAAAETCIIKYRETNYNKTNIAREQRKQYMLNNANACKFGSVKFNDSMLLKYGENNASKIDELLHTKKHKFRYNNIGFDSTAEIEVYKFCEAHELQFKYQPFSISYSDSTGKLHKYYPDFEINGKLYEVKGDHLLKDNKLYFPYRSRFNRRRTCYN